MYDSTTNHSLIINCRVVVKNPHEPAKPVEEILPVDAKRKIIAQETDPNGYVHKISMC